MISESPQGCRHCGGQMALVHSGAVCLECDARIVPLADLQDHYAKRVDGDSLPRIGQRSVNTIAELINLAFRLQNDDLTPAQRQRMQDRFDRKMGWGGVDRSQKRLFNKSDDEDQRYLF